MHQDAETIFNTAVQHHVAGRINDAVVRYQQALLRRPNYADAHNNLAVALVSLGKVDDALTHFERAIELKPTSAESHNNLGSWLAAQGRIDAAVTHFGRAIALRPDYAEAHFNRAEIRTFRAGDAELAELEALAAKSDSPFVHFALGKALEECGDFARAFEHLNIGNAAKRRQISYDEKSAAQLFERTRAVFHRGLFEQSVGEPSQVPVFVLGMPRSGSTLIEQILASHPQVHGAGELTALEQAVNSVLGSVQYPECVARLDAATLRRVGQEYIARLPRLEDGKTLVVDKLPGNFLNIGLIRLVLPGARIIHTLRDPMDTCVSCYSKLFTVSQHFCYELGELGRHYRRYRELMDYWRAVLPAGTILDVSYEDVVEDLEGQARRMIAYCDLPWDERCIEFHKTRRPVATASAVQARKPLYRSSLQRWRRYESQLDPLINVIHA
jgi:tetratricopeptide (TPR) repeat protein